MALLSPLGPQFFDNLGAVAALGKLYTYATGTTTPVTSYQDSAGTIPHTNPIILDSAGKVQPELWLTAGTSYRLRLLTSADVLIDEWDDIGGIMDGASLANTSNSALGDALVGVKQPDANSTARTQHSKNSDVVNLLDFAGADDTARFQNAVDSGKTVYVPQGAYTISTVSIGVIGCDLRFDKQAVVTITGNGFQRNLPQTPRATFIATHSLLDATNYYWTMRIRGGVFQVGAGAQAISDRVPFLVNTGASPSQILLRRNLIVEEVDIMLNDATAKGIGIYGGWGPQVKGGSITAAGLDAIAIDIGASSADGDVSCHPQEIDIDGVVFNSCRPFASAKNGCTNAAEDLTVRACKFNFVRLAELNNINSVRWVCGNLFVSDTKSLDIVDSGDVLIADSYFESNFDPDNSAKPGIVNCQNTSSLRIVNNIFNVLATSTTTARDGVLIKANASNAMTGVVVKNNRFQHAAYSATLETNAMRFATAGGTGQIIDIHIADNVCNDWHNAINFTDHITTQATRVSIYNTTNDGGVRFLKGIARIATNSLKAPGLWESFSFVISGQSRGGGTAANVLSFFWPFVQWSTTNPTVTISNFVNLAGCNTITATWAAIGANSVHIVGQQTAASAAGDLVQGSATLTIDGTLV